MRTTAVCTVRVREEEYAALARLTAEVARVTRALFHRMYQLDQPVEARVALRGVMAEGVVLKRHANSALLEAQGLARAWKERLTSERARLDERIRIIEAVLAQDAERPAAGEPPRGAWRRALDRRALYRADDRRRPSSWPSASGSAVGERFTVQSDRGWIPDAEKGRKLVLGDNLDAHRAAYAAAPAPRVPVRGPRGLTSGADVAAAMREGGQPAPLSPEERSWAASATRAVPLGLAARGRLGAAG